MQPCVSEEKRMILKKQIDICLEKLDEVFELSKPRVPKTQSVDQIKVVLPAPETVDNKREDDAAARCKEKANNTTTAEVIIFDEKQK